MPATHTIERKVYVIKSLAIRHQLLLDGLAKNALIFMPPDGSTEGLSEVGSARIEVTIFDEPVDETHGMLRQRLILMRAQHEREERDLLAMLSATGDTFAPSDDELHEALQMQRSDSRPFVRGEEV